MHDDDVMDRLLKDAMTADAPRLSREFDARVMRHVRRRRLTLVGRLAMTAYVAIALAGTAWAMRDLPMESIVAAAAIGLAVAGLAGAYGRRLALGR